MLLDIRVALAFGFLVLVFLLSVTGVVIFFETLLVDLVTFFVLVDVALGVTFLDVVLLELTVLGVLVFGVTFLDLVVVAFSDLLIVDVEVKLRSPRLDVVVAILFPPLLVASCL